MSDVPRWTAADSEVPSELGDWLRAGRADVGSAGEVAELARRVSMVLGPAAGLPGVEPAAELGPVDRAAGPPASGPSVRTDLSAGAGSASPAAVGGAARKAAWAITGAGGIVAACWVISALSSAAPEASAPEPAATEARPASAPPAPASLPTADKAPAPTLPAAPHPEPSAPSLGAPVQVAPKPRPPRAEPAARAQRSGGEARLLERAQAALEQRPAEALQLCQEHEARFPGGALVQEREVIAIEALKRLGRSAAARARAAEFERRFRGSVHQPRVEHATEAPPPDPTGGASSTP